MGSMLPYIAAPWIRHGIDISISFLHRGVFTILESWRMWQDVGQNPGLQYVIQWTGLLFPPVDQSNH